MSTLPSSNYLQRSLLINGTKDQLPKSPSPSKHQARVLKELQDLGMSRFALSTLESMYLPHIIRTNEHIGGVIYGRHKVGFAMIVATDRRIIFLDKKPLYVNEDEINYAVVSGVSYCHAGFGSTITLHTRITDYAIRTYNQKCAETFIEYIESRCLENQNPAEDYYDYFA